MTKQNDKKILEGLNPAILFLEIIEEVLEISKRKEYLHLRRNELLLCQKYQGFTEEELDNKEIMKIAKDSLKDFKRFVK